VDFVGDDVERLADDARHINHFGISEVALICAGLR
jgi:hypothetical protein